MIHVGRDLIVGLATGARCFSSSNTSPKVAVTGSTGYIGSYVVAELLNRGYTVHLPVRGSSSNPSKAAHLLALPGSERLTIFDGGDLTVDGSFDDAFKDCDAVIHTAAEVVLGKEQSIITASVVGTKNVLNSADRSFVKRFVQTSSVAAIQVRGEELQKPVDSRTVLTIFPCVSLRSLS